MTGRRRQHFPKLPAMPQSLVSDWCHSVAHIESFGKCCINHRGERKIMVSKRLVLVAAAALALLSLPVAAHAQPAGEEVSVEQAEPPCDTADSQPCTQVALQGASAAPRAFVLSEVELRYHRETTEHMNRPLAIQGAASSVRLPSQAELDYYRATTAHMNQPAAAASVMPVARPLTSSELHYHRDTVLHMHSR